MRSLKVLMAATLLAGLSFVFALDGAEDQTILQGLQGSPDQFSTFLSMLETAGLTDALQEAGPITVLAPTNAAFDAMDANILNDIQADSAELNRVLNGLILPGAYSMLDFKDAADGTLTPLSGEPYDIDVTAGGLKVNGVGFQATDIDNVFSNGVVHVSDLVVLPMSLQNLERQDATTDADTTPATEDAATDNAATDNATTDNNGAPVVPPVAVAPVTTPDATPDATTAEERETAFVRVVQLSPDTSVNAQLNPQDADLAAADFGAVDYGNASDYQEVAAGEYVINTTLPSDAEALFDEPDYTFRAGHYYTIVFSGLQIPGESDAEAEGEGFGGWLRNLFGSKDTNRDVLARKVTIYEDEVRDDATDSRVRVIDAAPGSPAFDVVAINAAGERSVLAGNMTYGDDSGAKVINDDVTNLEVTAADSAAVAMQLEDAMPLPRDTTIFLIGTTFEGAPYKMLVLPNGSDAAMDATTGN